jgi:hypothetical protein
MSARPTGPDFVVVGAQRSGTTWLYAVLARHPQLWLAPVKELHYFDKPGIRRTFLDARERRRVGFSGIRSPAFWLRFWLGARDDAWYASLFRGAQRRGLVAGEITPAYAALPEDALRRLHALSPRVKLAFVMRDPVSRTWSALNHGFEKRGGAPGALAVDEALARARRGGVVARSDYLDTIARLERVFPREQLHFAFFDELRDDPRAFTKRFLSFLGVDPAWAERLTLPPAANTAAAPNPVPSALARTLAREYLPMVRSLCERFDGAPQRWRARYEALLADARADESAA